jgi:DNA invertase Pin-like site-specific DNA recombinase
MKTAIYLRKSRSDEELEKRLGEGETLHKHRNMLLKFAKEKNLSIIKIFEEIVSGESLFHRPQMLELLKEVETNNYEAILCMDIDRLGRGNMQEQGIILETFKKSNTKIITPRKTYNLQDDFDEEYSEFEAFMSRKELKLINRRLQRGRLHSINEGNYIATLPPYGYIKSNGTLVPHPDQSQVVQIIFELYTQENMATKPIANYLNSLGIKSYTNINWTAHAVSSILNNAIYAGKIVWKKKESRKPNDPAKRREVRKRSQSEWIIVDGKHEALISEAVYNKAQEIKQSKFSTPVKLGVDLVNPLASLIICKICGAKMCRRPYQNQLAHLRCPSECGNKSVRFEFVVQRVIETLEKIFSSQYNNNLENYIPTTQILEKSIQAALQEKEKLENQKLKLYDLLEQNIYDVATFLERSKTLANKINDIDTTIKELSIKIQEENEKKIDKNFFEKGIKVLESYKLTDEIIEKNKLLKTILEKAVYYKSKDQRGDNFELLIYPKYPN